MTLMLDADLLTNAERDELDDVRKRALTEVNEIRAGYGAGPLDDFPKGTVSSERDCPAAKALDMLPENTYPVVSYNSFSMDFQQERDLPPALRDFVAYVTMGLYPDLKEE